MFYWLRIFTILASALMINNAAANPVDPPLTPALTPDTSHELINEVLARKDFHQLNWERGFESTDPNQSDTLNDDPNGQSNSIIDSILLIIAQSFEFIIWIILAITVAYCIAKYPIWRQWLLRSKHSAAPPGDRQQPVELFGLSLDEATLPTNIPDEVRALWAKKMHRQALSLLYRGTLTKLVSHYDLSFSPGDTEHQCYLLVCQSPQCSDELTQYIQHLTQIWQQLAYGHQATTTHTVEQLCQAWGKYFDMSHSSNKDAQDVD